MRWCGCHRRYAPWRGAGLTGVLALVASLFLVLGARADEPGVSLDDARKITAQLESQGFAPPPRTISDITAILDGEKPDPAQVAAARAKADAVPPAGLAGLEAARLYFDRGSSAGDLGRGAQRLAD
jgi:hypothetical protein